MEQINSLQPVGQAAEFKFDSKFEPLPDSASYLAITPEGFSIESKVLGTCPFPNALSSICLVVTYDSSPHFQVKFSVLCNDFKCAVIRMV